MRRRPTPVLAAVALVWGSVGSVVRQVPLPAAAIASARVWIATLALGCLLASGRAPGPRLFSVHRVRVVAAGAILAAHWVALFAAYQRAPVAWVVFVVYLAPLLMTALAPAVLGERVDTRHLVPLAVAVAGFAVLARPSGAAAGGHAVTSTGLVLTLFAAASFAALVLVSKPAVAAYGGARFAFAQLAVAGVCLLPVAAAAGWGPPRAAWAWLLVLGLVHTAAALALYFWALARLPVARLATLTYLEPVSAAVFAWVVLGERPTVATAIGGALIVVAGLLLVVDHSDRLDRSAAPTPSATPPPPPAPTRPRAAS